MVVHFGTSCMMKAAKSSGVPGFAIAASCLKRVLHQIGECEAGIDLAR